MFKFKLKKPGPRRKRRQAKKDAAEPMRIQSRFIWMAAALLALAWFVIFLTMVFAKADWFNIGSVEVQGSEGLDSCGPGEFLRLYGGRNIFSVDIGALAGGIARRYPDAKSVVARRKLPNTLKISIVLRRPIALVSDDKYYPVDSEGVILPNADASAWQKLPVITGVNVRESDKAGGVCGSRPLSIALGLIIELSRARILSEYSITAIDVTDPKNAAFFFEDGLEVKIGHESFRERLQRLSQTLKNPRLILSRIKYIDLRFKDIVIGQK